MLMFWESMGEKVTYRLSYIILVNFFLQNGRRMLQ